MPAEALQTVLQLKFIGKISEHVQRETMPAEALQTVLQIKFIGTNIRTCSERKVKR